MKRPSLLPVSILSLATFLLLYCDSPNPVEYQTTSISFTVAAGQKNGFSTDQVGRIEVLAIHADGDTSIEYFEPSDTAVSLRLPAGFTGTIELLIVDLAGVTAYRGISDITGSQPVTIDCVPLPPPSPTDVAVFQVTYSEATVAWKDNAFNEQGYRLIRSHPESPDTLLLQANTETFVDTMVVPGRARKYSLCAFNEAGFSSPETLSVDIPHFVHDISAGTDTSVAVGETLVLHGRARDPNAAVDFYTWSFEKGTPQTDTAENLKTFMSVAPEDPGVYEAIFTATSRRGYTASDTVQVTVKMITLTGTAMLQDFDDTTRSIHIRITDASDAVLDSFHVSNGGAFTKAPVNRRSAFITASYEGFSSARQQLHIAVLDTCRLETPLLLADTASPRILHLQPSTTVRMGAPVRFSATAVDSPYTEPLLMSWSYHGDGDFDTVANPHSFWYTDTGSFSAVFTAQDSRGNSSTAIRNITVLPLQLQGVHTTETGIQLRFSRYAADDFVSYRLLDTTTGELWQSTDPTDTIVRLSGLTRGTEYPLRLVWTFAADRQWSTDTTVVTAKPVAPQPRIDTAFCSAIALSWPQYAGEGFVAYEIMRKSGAEYEVLGIGLHQADNTQAIVDHLLPNNEYTFQLTTILTDPVDTLRSEEITAGTLELPPATISLARIQGDSVFIQWTPPHPAHECDGFSWYRIEATTETGEEYLGQKLTEPGLTAAVYTAPQRPQVYKIRLRTVLGEGEQTLVSNAITAPVDIPRTWPELTVAATTANSVSLDWTPYTGTGFTAYRVMREFESFYDTYWRIEHSITNRTDTSHTVGGLRQGTPYRFRIDTEAEYPTEKAESNTVSATPH